MTSQRPQVVDPAASMALLRTVLRDADEQYAVVRPGARAPGPVRRTLLAVVCAALGLLVVSAVLQWRATSQTRSQEHDSLVARIEERTAELDRRQGEIDSAQARIADAERTAVTRSGEGARLAARLEAVEAAAARTPVQGPGVRVTVQDAEADPITGERPEGGDVLDRDLQLVANGLWQAGAEAVAVNGHRLGPTTAIRAAGEAILVNLRALAPPYVVTAIGGDALAERFEQGRAAASLRGLAQDYGLRWTLERVAELSLSAAPGGSA